MSTTLEVVTQTEAISKLGVSRKNISTWITRKYIRSHGTVLDSAYRVIKTYRVKDILACKEKYSDQPIPDGHIKLTDAARRLRVHYSTVKTWVQRGRLKAVPVMRNGQEVLFIQESSIEAKSNDAARHTAVSSRADVSYTFDALDSRTVLYGLLTEWDVAVLEKRRERWGTRTGVNA